MDTYSQTQVFFLISSIGFIFLWILMAIFLFYLVRAAGALSRIMEKVERNVNNIGDATKELLEEMKNNIIFKFLFGKKRSRKD